MTKRTAQKPTRRTVPTHISLPPAAYGALGLLALTQAAGGRPESTPVLVRLIRAELERELPGSWPAALSAALGCPEGATPGERAAAAYRALEALYAQRPCRHPSVKPGAAGWKCTSCGEWLRPEEIARRGSAPCSLCGSVGGLNYHDPACTCACHANQALVSMQPMPD